MSKLQNLKRSIETSNENKARKRLKSRAAPDEDGDIPMNIIEEHYKYCNSEDNLIIKDWLSGVLDEHFSIKPKFMKPVPSIFEGIDFQETVTKKTLQELKKRDLLRKEATDEEQKLNRKAEVTRLTKLMKYIKKNNTMIVKYSKKKEHPWGRVRPWSSQSLGSIR
jgi:hypothetical protein